MLTLVQLTRNQRKICWYKDKRIALNKCPQKRGTCLKINVNTHTLLYEKNKLYYNNSLFLAISNFGFIYNSNTNIVALAVLFFCLVILYKLLKKVHSYKRITGFDTEAMIGAVLMLLLCSQLLLIHLVTSYLRMYVIISSTYGTANATLVYSFLNGLFCLLVFTYIFFALSLSHRLLLRITEKRVKFAWWQFICFLGVLNTVLPVLICCGVLSIVYRIELWNAGSFSDIIYSNRFFTVTVNTEYVSTNLLTDLVNQHIHWKKGQCGGAYNYDKYYSDLWHELRQCRDYGKSITRLNLVELKALPVPEIVVEPTYWENFRTFLNNNAETILAVSFVGLSAAWFLGIAPFLLAHGFSLRFR